MNDHVNFNGNTHNASVASSNMDDITNGNTNKGVTSDMDDKTSSDGNLRDGSGSGESANDPLTSDSNADNNMDDDATTSDNNMDGYDSSSMSKSNMDDGDTSGENINDPATYDNDKDDIAASGGNLNDDGISGSGDNNDALTSNNNTGNDTTNGLDVENEDHLVIRTIMKPNQTLFWNMIQDSFPFAKENPSYKGLTLTKLVIRRRGSDVAAMDPKLKFRKHTVAKVL